VSFKAQGKQQQGANISNKSSVNEKKMGVMAATLRRNQ